MANQPAARRRPGPPTLAGASPPVPALLAVDGGASKTDVLVVAADGTVLADARGPGSNHQVSGVDAAMDALNATIRAALRSAGMRQHDDGGDPARSAAGRAGARPCAIRALGVYCLAGLDLPSDETRLEEAVTSRAWTSSCVLRNDTFAVLRAGATAGWGVGVVCGTGLNCVGTGPRGEEVRFPALGELSGDFAPGGAWLGMRGLGTALRAADGRGAPTALRDMIAEHLAMSSPEAVLEAAYAGTLHWGRLAGLAEVVLEAARLGDGPAMDLVDHLGAEVVAMVAATIDRLGIAQAGPEVVAGGGIFEDDRFADLVMAGVRRRAPGAVLRRLVGVRPVLGAALIGLDLIGAEQVAIRRLRETLAPPSPPPRPEPAGHRE